MDDALVPDARPAREKGLRVDVVDAGGQPAAGVPLAFGIVSPSRPDVFHELLRASSDARGAAWIELSELARMAGASVTRGALTGIDAWRHSAHTSTNHDIEYDVLLVACGALPLPAVKGAVTDEDQPQRRIAFFGEPGKSGLQLIPIGRFRSILFTGETDRLEIGGRFFGRPSPLIAPALELFAVFWGARCAHDDNDRRASRRLRFLRFLRHG